MHNTQRLAKIKKESRWLDAYQMDALGQDARQIATTLHCAISSIPVFVSKGAELLHRLDVEKVLDVREQAVNRHRYYSSLALEDFERAAPLLDAVLQVKDATDTAMVLGARTRLLQTASKEAIAIEHLQGLHASKDVAPQTQINQVLINLPGLPPTALADIPTATLHALIDAAAPPRLLPPEPAPTLDPTIIDGTLA